MWRRIKNTQNIQVISFRANKIIGKVRRENREDRETEFHKLLQEEC